MGSSVTLALRSLRFNFSRPQFVFLREIRVSVFVFLSVSSVTLEFPPLRLGRGEGRGEVSLH